jgi:PIN domain nuclease of toxin-antitoxin system
MKCLLDTHAVLWFAEGSPRLSANAMRVILSPENEKYVSIVSAWEIAIKLSLRKLQLEGGAGEFFRITEVNGFVLLPVDRRAIECVETLPFHHRDPFDRLLIATTYVQGMSLVSADENILKYDVPRIW